MKLIGSWLLQESIEKLTDDELRAKSDEFRKRIKSGNEDVNGPLLEEAFAVSPAERSPSFPVPRYPPLLLLPIIIGGQRGCMARAPASAL